MADLTSQLERAAEPKPIQTVRELVERMQPQLVKSLGNERNAQALMRHYMTAVRLNPQLQECDPESLLAALLLSAQVRLEPGPLGHVYLVPFKRECVWILGYTGMMELARRSERVAALSSSLVYENDVYETPWQDEKGVHYTHRPAADERGDRRAVLVTWREKVGGSWTPRALHVGPERIERARQASPAAKRGAGPWHTDESAMWLKTGIRAARAWLPLLPDAAYAMQVDESRAVRVETDEDGYAVPVMEAGESDA